MTFRRTKRSQRRYKLPVLAQEVIDTYLNRPLDDYEFLKAAPPDELLQEIEQGGYRFVTTPWEQQLVCFLIGMHRPAFLYYLAAGGGKTKLIVDLFRYRKQRGEATCGMILVPELLHISPWEEQIPQHAPELKFKILIGSKEERLDALETNADLFIMNYKGLEAYMTSRRKVKKKKSEELINKQMLDEDEAVRFVRNFDFFAIDEMHRIRTAGSLLIECLTWLSQQCPFRYGLTATPFGRDPSPLWPQWSIIDHGETLGNPQSMFRGVFFNSKQNWWGGVDYDFRKDMSPQLHRIIKHRSIVYTEEELKQKLPKLVPMKINLDLTPEGQVFYDRIIEKAKEARGSYRSLDSTYIRMRQCVSGFLSLKADADDERIEVRFDKNPKLDALTQMLQDSMLGHKFLCYHYFRYSGRMICELLEEHKIKFIWMVGGIKDVLGEFNKFKRLDSVQVAVAQHQVGSEAINPQEVCNREVYFESPDDAITRIQAEKRIKRPGQKSGYVLVYDLVMRNTIEERLLKFQKEGKDLLQAILSGEESLLGD